jgi:hypothetical protein
LPHREHQNETTTAAMLHRSLVLFETFISRRILSADAYGRNFDASRKFRSFVHGSMWLKIHPLLAIFANLTFTVTSLPVDSKQFSWFKCCFRYFYLPMVRLKMINKSDWGLVGEILQFVLEHCGRVVHGAFDSQACYQCLCGVWVRSQLSALDMLHRIKGIFGADHVPVVSCGHSGFLHHQKGPIPPMSWVGATLSLPCSPWGE